MSKPGLEASAAAAPTFDEALRVWFRIGLLSFGGPAGQIALMHKTLVDEKKWIDEKSYLSALNFCMLLPGPEAMQLATYVGWRLHGLKGGLAAGLLFVIPGALVILALSALYAAFGKLPLTEALFIGVKAAVLAIVVEALLRVARRGLKLTSDWMIAAGAFLAIYFLAVPYPLIVLAAALIGAIRARGDAPSPHVAPMLPVATGQTLRTVLIWLGIWFIPLAVIAAVFGRGHVLTDLGLFFSKLAVVTFGGAYAVLAYMTQDVVQYYRWLSAGEMLDALGLAETTPGPLILVTEFVGFLSAYRHGGGTGAGAWGYGVLGAVVTLWVTFVPCFLWIFAGAPYIDRINSNPKLKSALAAITAAVVGVILSLTVWFALHVLFAKVGLVSAGPFRFQAPSWAALDAKAFALFVVAGVLLFAFHRGIMTVLAICVALAIAAYAAGW